LLHNDAAAATHTLAETACEGAGAGAAIPFQQLDRRRRASINVVTYNNILFQVTGTFGNSNFM
jgi:hypothetical protein